MVNAFEALKLDEIQDCRRIFDRIAIDAHTFSMFSFGSFSMPFSFFVFIQLFSIFCKNLPLFSLLLFTVGRRSIFVFSVNVHRVLLLFMQQRLFTVLRNSFSLLFFKACSQLIFIT